MSKDSKADVKRHVAGSLKEAIGKITGDTDVQAEGAAEKKSGSTDRETSAKATKSKKNPPV